MNVKRIGAVLVALFVIVCLPTTQKAHAHDKTHPESMQVVLPGQFTHVGFFEELQRPEKATQCGDWIRPSRTSAVARCYGWNGGSRSFIVQGLAWKCNQMFWISGSVGRVGNGGSISSKDSFAYTPGAGWIFIDSKYIAFLP